MKILVTGREGQLARSLIERVEPAPGVELVAIGRPELDLGQPGSAAKAIEAIRPDVVINAAAYTAVDQAEDEPELAMRINAEAAGEVAAAAAKAGAAVIQLSTDYVFDGTGVGRLSRGRADGAARRLWPHQARRRGTGPRRQPAPSHRPDRLGVQPVRAQFRQDDDGSGRNRATCSPWSTTNAVIQPRRSTSPTGCSQSCGGGGEAAGARPR